MTAKIFGKALILVLILLYTQGIVCVQGQDLRDFQWLEGHWTQIGMPDTVSAGEIWRLEKSGTLIGFGYEMHHSDTIFKEQVRIIKTRNGVFYVVDVNHNPNPVYFILVNSDTNKWVFENPEHDFPSTIAYIREDFNSMTCVIEGKGHSRNFTFLKQSETDN